MAYDTCYPVLLLSEFAWSPSSGRGLERSRLATTHDGAGRRETVLRLRIDTAMWAAWATDGGAHNGEVTAEHEAPV